MGFPILVRWHLHIESGPKPQHGQVYLLLWAVKYWQRQATSLVTMPSQTLFGTTIDTSCWGKAGIFVHHAASQWSHPTARQPFTNDLAYYHIKHTRAFYSGVKVSGMLVKLYVCGVHQRSMHLVHVSCFIFVSYLLILPISFKFTSLSIIILSQCQWSYPEQYHMNSLRNIKCGWTK